MAIIKIKNAAIDLDAAEIPNLPASKITSGTFANDKLTGSGAITINGSAVALGASTTIETGLSWQSTIVTASTLAAVSGNGYWINTTSNACTITLPANPSLGDEIVFVDYARNWGTNAITINPNSKNFQGNTSPNPVYNTSGQSVSIVYSDATQGWIPTVDDDVTLETPQSYSLEMLVIAGGAGGGGQYYGGGGGAGGYRTSTQTITPGTVFTVTVGDGGASGTSSSKGGNGSNSSISGSGLTTITSAGGGGGGQDFNNRAGNDGGSGGGGSGYNSSSTGGGSGNTPSTSPSQGNNGGSSTASGVYGSGGGGGAGAVGGSTSNNNGAAGGAGTASSITGSSVTRAGGGGGNGSNDGSAGGTQGAGGAGGGGAGGRQSPVVQATAGTVNTGGGGGAGSGADGGAGGKGVIILSIPDSNYSGTTTGSPTVVTGVSGKTVLTFTSTGSYTA